MSADYAPDGREESLDPWRTVLQILKDGLVVDLAVLVNQRVAESDHGFHGIGDVRNEEPLLLESVENTVIAGRRGPPVQGNDPGGKIDAGLDGQLKCSLNDIAGFKGCGIGFELEILIFGKYIEILFRGFREVFQDVVADGGGHDRGVG